MKVNTVANLPFSLAHGKVVAKHILCTSIVHFSLSENVRTSLLDTMSKSSSKSFLLNVTGQARRKGKWLEARSITAKW